nr:unnamed protein product [Callosobruchus chinensis]
MSLQFFFEGTGFMFLYDKWENLSLFDINSVIFIYSTALLNLLMMILIHSKIKSVHFIQSTMQSTMFQPKSQSQAESAEKWKGVARLFQKLFFSNNLFNNIAIIILAILKDQRLILAAHKPSVVHWKVFFVFQAIMCTYSAHMCTVYATLFTSLMIEVIIQLNLIEEALKDTGDHDELKQCVKWHLQVLVFFKEVDRLCGIGISSVLSCGILNMCTSMSLLLQVQRSDMVFILPYIVVILTVMYSQCWCGSEIVDQSEKMSYAIYSSEWVDGDLSYKKLINMYISLTKKPLAIRLGGGITIATLPVFVRVIS